MAIGKRDEATTRDRWASLPAVDRPCAVGDPALWKADAAVLPSNRHRAVSQERGETSPIDRRHTTFRPRVSRLVRRTLSFSQKVATHLGAVWYDGHHHHA